MHGLRKQGKKFHAITWPKVFCKVADTQLNLDLKLLAIGTETKRERSADCCPLCFSTRLHHPLSWGSRTNGASTSEPLQFQAWCIHFRVHLEKCPNLWRLHPSLQWTEQGSQDQLKFSQQWKQKQMLPPGLKTNASPPLPWVAKRKEEEGGLRWRPRVTDSESCVACFCRSPEWDERGGENPRLA